MVPGWRVGWMRFTHTDKMKDLIPAIIRLASGRLCSPTPTQYAVRPALTGNRDFLKNFLREIKSRRDCALRHIGEIDGLSCSSPDAAFYMMIKVNDRDRRKQTDERFVLDLLEETGVLVVHGSGFGCKETAGYFRLVYLANEETLNTAFTKIGNFMSNRSPQTVARG
jgi:alanine-synthesizing transaminase